MASIWIAELRVSDGVRAKINAKHGISADEVADAVVCVRGLPFRWDWNPDRGRRAVISVRIQGPGKVGS